MNERIKDGIENTIYICDTDIP